MFLALHNESAPEVGLYFPTGTDSHAFVCWPNNSLSRRLVVKEYRFRIYCGKRPEVGARLLGKQPGLGIDSQGDEQPVDGGVKQGEAALTVHKGSVVEESEAKAPVFVNSAQGTGCD